MKRTFLAFAAGALFMLACGNKYAGVAEYIIDVKAGMLRAAEPKNDKPLAYCETEVCYAYKEADVTAIKKYIASLEERLKACQKGD